MGFIRFLGAIFLLLPLGVFANYTTQNFSTFQQFK